MVLQPSSLSLSSHPASATRSLIRIAAALKSAPLTLVDQHFEFPKRPTRKNPVPTLTVSYPSIEMLTIKQSLAMLEFIDEAYTRPLQLIPPITDIRKRYWTRDLAALVQCDVQPLQKNKIIHMIEQIGGDMKLWTRNLQISGLRNYEIRVRHSMRRFSVGDEPSLADVCLYPMVQRARKQGVKAEKLGLKLVMKIVEECDKLDAFRLGVMESQEGGHAQAEQKDQPNEFGMSEPVDDQSGDEVGYEEVVPLPRIVPA